MISVKYLWNKIIDKINEDATFFSLEWGGAVQKNVYITAKT